MPTGVNVSKGVAFAVTTPPTGASVSKAVAYAVIYPTTSTPLTGGNAGSAPTESWVDMPLAIQDYAVGFEEINRIRDNLENIRQLFAVAHSTGSTSGGGSFTLSNRPWEGYGWHKEKTVARIVLHFNYSLFGGTVPTMTAALSNTAYGGITRNGVGDYFIALPSLSSFSQGPVTPERGANVRYGHARYSASPAGLIVGLWDNWVRADYSFSLVVYEAP